MKFCRNTIAVRRWAANVLMFLVLTSNFGCGIIKSSTSRTLEMKPLEEMLGEYYKKLRIAEELTIETEISSQIFISRGAPNYDVDYLKANLKILPMIDSRQKISGLEITPPGKIAGRALEFRIDDPSPGRHEFKLKAEVKLRHEFVQVTDKIPFPIKDIPTDQTEYTEPSVIIDSDDEGVRSLALSIAQGEDDLYRVVFKVSEWVRENVQADSDISTISTSQKASWVLEHRKGVCDEKSNLFIGLLRSLGIPAKFITGFVGVNYNTKITFKPHGWAEVYFPSVGWIPFDIAYNQLGFIDATHIKLTESVDTSDPLAAYEWKSENALVSIKDFVIRTNIKQRDGVIHTPLAIKPTAWHLQIDAGSYNVIEVTVINPHKFYMITDMCLQVPNELKIMGNNNKMLLMEPEKRKTLYWIVKPTIDMERTRTVMFPVNVVSSRNDSGSVKFEVAKAQGYPKYSFKLLKNEVEMKMRRTAKER